MNEFKQYNINEYKPKLNSFVTVDFKFSHSSNTRLDKNSGKPLVNNIIMVNINFIDNQCNTLLTNLLAKSCSNKLHHISPKELNKKFGYARNEIINEILNQYKHKSSELSHKIDSINIYKGGPNTIIPFEFKGVSIILTSDKSALRFNPLVESPITKKIFDMQYLFIAFSFQIQMSEEADIITEPVEPIIKKDKRGRKPKYATAEVPNQAAILHQHEYRKRKRLQFESMQNKINELTTMLEQANASK